MGIVARIGAALAALLVAGGAAPVRIGGFGLPDAVPGADLSLMTYNVRGLPWPVATGRDEALDEIADRLSSLRARGLQPRVVVLQEAFTERARSIGRAAGYAHVVDDRTPAPIVSSSAARASAPGGGPRWWRGEGDGAPMGSGLAVLSDFPILSVRRTTFPACAGWDCLAAKGALLVRLRVPGVATPVDVVAVHMNSRGASGVEDARSDAAHAAQADALTRFVAAARDPDAPLLVAGDLNVGRVAVRRADVVGLADARWGASGPVRIALEEARDDGMALLVDARRTLRRGKDLEFYAPGTRAAPVLVGVTTPFGRNVIGEMLSDHVGYVGHFRIEPSPVRSVDRPRA